MDGLPTSESTIDEQEINFHESGTITFLQYCVQVGTGFARCAWNMWQYDGKFVVIGGEFSADGVRVALRSRLDVAANRLPVGRGWHTGCGPLLCDMKTRPDLFPTREIGRAFSSLLRSEGIRTRLRHPPGVAPGDSGSDQLSLIFDSAERPLFRVCASALYFPHPYGFPARTRFILRRLR